MFTVQTRVTGTGTNSMLTILSIKIFSALADIIADVVRAAAAIFARIAVTLINFNFTCWSFNCKTIVNVIYPAAVIMLNYFMIFKNRLLRAFYNE